jgi:NADH-quinone oxidoreductase subunit M
MIVLTIMGAVIVFVCTRYVSRYVALIFSILPFTISIFLCYSFDLSNPSYQFVEEYEWVRTLGITYKVGIDGISLPFVFLTTLLTTMAVIFSWDINKKDNQFFALLLVLEVGLLGVFISLDFFLFYVFWEVVLIPMFFLIHIWGGPNRGYAAIKFLIYTHVASVIMLLAIMAMYFEVGNFSMELIAAKGTMFSTNFQIAVFLALLIGFGVKMPIVPLHTWLPDAHVEAPTAGSVLLAGVLLKMGGYGLVRVAVTTLPDGREFFVPIMMGIGILSILYAAVVCLAQKDFKRMVAYSSVSHMGIVLLGVSTLNSIGVGGAIFQMFAHGLITAVLFMMAGVIHHKTGTRDIPRLHGLNAKMPIAMTILVIGSLASLGLPGLVSFVSEVLVFVGTYKAFSYLVFIPLIGVVLTAGYYLWTLQKIAFGPYRRPRTAEHITDVDFYEFVPLAILIGLITIFGVYPAPILDMINASLPQLGGLP